MENPIKMNVRGCEIEIDLTYAVKTEGEKKKIIQHISKIYAQHEWNKK